MNDLISNTFYFITNAVFAAQQVLKLFSIIVLGGLLQGICQIQLSNKITKSEKVNFLTVLPFDLRDIFAIWSIQFLFWAQIWKYFHCSSWLSFDKLRATNRICPSGNCHGKKHGCRLSVWRCFEFRSAVDGFGWFF